MNTPLKQHRHPGLWSQPSGRNAHRTLALTTGFSQSTDLANDVTNDVASDVSQQAKDIQQLHRVLQQVSPQERQAGKWVTLIGQPSCPMARQVVESVLTQHCIPLHKVRWIRSKDAANNAWAAEQAVLLDNSAIVFGWLGQCEWRDLKRLQLATKHTQALCWFSTTGVDQTPLH